MGLNNISDIRYSLCFWSKNKVNGEKHCVLTRNNNTKLSEQKKEK